jgi:hypothetical protein
MPVNISIKDVPDDIAEALRLRAQANHRSMQGELMAMLERYTSEKPFRALEWWDDIQKLGIRTPGQSTRWIGEDRNRR